MCDQRHAWVALYPRGKDACVQTSSEAHPTSYPMNTGGSFPEVGVFDVPITIILLHEHNTKFRAYLNYLKINVNAF
jgi:hypothetical protein